MGVRATKAKVEVPLHEVARLRDGRLCDVQAAVDLAGVARQLGLMPAPDAIPRPLLQLLALRQRRRVRAAARGPRGWTRARRSGIVASGL